MAPRRRVVRQVHRHPRVRAAVVQSVKTPAAIQGVFARVPCQSVIAALPAQVVSAIPAAQFVIAIPPAQVVSAHSAVQVVSAGAAIQYICAHIPHKRVAAGITGEHIIEVRAPNVFHFGKNIALGMPPRGKARRKVDNHPLIRPPVIQGVQAGPAGQHIRPRPAPEIVVASIASKHIVVRAAVEMVAAITLASAVHQENNHHHDGQDHNQRVCNG